MKGILCRCICLGVLGIRTLSGQVQLPGSNGNTAEVFIWGDGTYTATVEDRFAMEMDLPLERDTTLDVANSGNVYHPEGWVGFDFYGFSGNLESLGRGLYKIHRNGSPENGIYFDTRDCDYIIHGTHGDTPDLFFDWELSSFAFFLWKDFENWITLSPGDTVQLGWAWLPEDVVVNASNVDDLPANNNYDCFETDVTLTMKYNTETLNGTFEIPSLYATVPSGNLVTLIRAAHTRIVSPEEVQTASGEWVRHHHWEALSQDENVRTLSNRYLTDLPEEVVSRYDRQFETTFTTNTGGALPIAIQDPWWVDADGNQPSTFQELNPGSQSGLPLMFKTTLSCPPAAKSL